LCLFPGVRGQRCPGTLGGGLRSSVTSPEADSIRRLRSLAHRRVPRKRATMPNYRQPLGLSGFESEDA
jgi:hypothetical protein